MPRKLLSGASRQQMSLREMLELNARFFLNAVTELRAIQVVLQNVINMADMVGDADNKILLDHLERMGSAIEAIGARSAYKSADRLESALKGDYAALNYEFVSNGLADIESRFADHLEDIQLYVANNQEVAFLGAADDLIEIGGFSVAFPNAALELEESSKCIVFGRHTASVFHAMRVLEYGIRALAASLGIEDPLKAQERNWSIVLGKIRDKLDSDWPRSRRLANTKGAELEGLYATLDAVKSPWRNATMHVENVYLPHEALHILRCVGFFMQKLIRHCDEKGHPTDTPELLPATDAHPIVDELESRG